MAYVESLGPELNEWLLALYVKQLRDNFELLAVDTIAQGGVDSVRMPFGKIIYRGQQLGAEGFILVHNHPSGDPTPGPTDLKMTRRLAGVSRDLDMPLLCHYVIARGGMQTVCEW